MTSLTSVLILAAGSGTRLFPYTKDIPKCMVPLAGAPLISRQLAVLKQANLSDVSIVGGYKSDALDSLGVRVWKNSAYQTSNMVWSMMCARELFDGQRTVIVAYGDIVYEKSVLEGLVNSTGHIAVVSDRSWRKLWSLRMEDPLSDAETFQLNSEGTLAGLGARADTYDQIEGQYIGLLKFGPGSHAQIQQKFSEMERVDEEHRAAVMNLYMTDFVQNLIEDGEEIHISWTDGCWLEVDTTSDKETYERLAQEGSLDEYCKLEVIAS